MSFNGNPKNFNFYNFGIVIPGTSSDHHFVFCYRFSAWLRCTSENWMSAKVLSFVSHCSQRYRSLLSPHYVTKYSCFAIPVWFRSLLRHKLISQNIKELQYINMHRKELDTPGSTIYSSTVSFFICISFVHFLDM